MSGQLQMTTTRVLNGPADVSHARCVFDFCRALYSAPQIAADILAISSDQAGSKPISTASSLTRLRRWQQQGGFIEPASLHDVSSWFAGDFIIAQILQPGEACMPVSQCIGRMPEGGTWIVPLLDAEHDEILDWPLYEELLSDGPAASGLLDFLGVLPGYTGRGFAAAVEAVLAHMGRLNEGRSTPVKRSVGLAFVIQGLRDVDRRRTIRLMDIAAGELANGATLRSNVENASGFRGRLLGRWRGAPPVPVSVAGREYEFLIDWLVIIHQVPELGDEGYR